MALKKNFVWSGEKLVLTDLRFHHPNYPLIVKVHKKKTWTSGNERLLLLHGWESQERIMARNQQNQVIGIPIDHPQKIIVCGYGKQSKGKSGEGKAHSVHTLMQNYSPPIEARFSESTNTKFYIGKELFTSRTFGSMTIEKIHTLDYLVTSSIEDSGAINTRDIGTFPIYLDLDMTKAVAIKTMSDEDFTNLVKEYEAATKYLIESKIETTRDYGLGSIMGYDEETNTWSCSNSGGESSSNATTIFYRSLPDSPDKPENPNPYMSFVQKRQSHNYKALSFKGFLSKRVGSLRSSNRKASEPRAALQQRVREQLNKPIPEETVEEEPPNNNNLDETPKQRSAGDNWGVPVPPQTGYPIHPRQEHPLPLDILSHYPHTQPPIIHDHTTFAANQLPPRSITPSHHSPTSITSNPHQDLPPSRTALHHDSAPFPAILHSPNSASHYNTHIKSYSETSAVNQAVRNQDLAARPLPPLPNEIGGEPEREINPLPRLTKPTPFLSTQTKDGLITELGEILKRRKVLSDSGPLAYKSGMNYKGDGRGNPGTAPSVNIVRGFSKKIAIAPPQPRSCPPKLSDIPQDISSLTVQDVSHCLKLLNLERYAEAFEEEQVDGSLLQSFTVNDFMDMGLPGSQAKKLYQFAVDGWRPKF